MANKHLDNLVSTGLLKTEPPAASEIEGLLRSGESRLEDAERTALSLDSRFDLAYNAAHALSLAALRHHGYRPEKRYIVFQSLAHTLSMSAPEWRVLADAHRKRNIVEYEGVAEIDEPFLEAVLRVTREVAKRVRALVAARP
jgi:hypothetical protein